MRVFTGCTVNINEWLLSIFSCLFDCKSHMKLRDWAWLKHIDKLRLLGSMILGGTSTALKSLWFSQMHSANLSQLWNLIISTHTWLRTYTGWLLYPGGEKNCLRGIHTFFILLYIMLHPVTLTAGLCWNVAKYSSSRETFWTFISIYVLYPRWTCVLMCFC